MTVWRQVTLCESRRDRVAAGKILSRQGLAGETVWGQARTCGSRDRAVAGETV